MLDRERTWQTAAHGGPAEYTGLFDKFPDVGHDYRRADNGDIEVDEKRVSELLAKRLHARLSRDFVVADNLRGELRKMGVEVVDQEKSWTAVAPDGDDFGGGRAFNKAGGGGGGGDGGGGGGGGEEEEREDRRGGRDRRSGRDDDGDDDDDDDERRDGPVRGGDSDAEAAKDEPMAEGAKEGDDGDGDGDATNGM